MAETVSKYVSASFFSIFEDWFNFKGFTISIKSPPHTPFFVVTSPVFDSGYSTWSGIPLFDSSQVHYENSISLFAIFRYKRMLFTNFPIYTYSLMLFRIYQNPNLVTELPFSLLESFIRPDRTPAFLLALNWLLLLREMTRNWGTPFCHLCGTTGMNQRLGCQLDGPWLSYFTEVNLEFPFSTYYKGEAGKNGTHCLLPWILHETVQILSCFLPHPLEDGFSPWPGNTLHPMGLFFLQ